MAEQTTASPQQTADQLRVLYQLEEGTSAAGATDSMYAADDLVATYVRLREQARQFHVVNGRPTEVFDREVPPWTENAAVRASRIGAITGNPREMLERSARARHLLAQLEGWVRANIRAVEFERRQQIEAEARATEATEARAAQAQARALEAEARAAEAQKKADAAEAQTRARRRISRSVILGMLLILGGVAVGVTLPLLVVASSKLGISAAVVGGIGLIVLGIRVIVGPKLGGEVMIFVSLLAIMAGAAVVVIESH
jgi:hypothetical protein